MLDIKVRRFQPGDEGRICEVIRKDILAEMINDYPVEMIDKLVETLNEELIVRRSNKFHTYVVTDDYKIIGVGTIGPYWNSKVESSFFNIFRDPDYNKKGIGRKIIETLEQDEYFKNADRVEIPASITAVEFYKHFGYGFKRTNEVIGYISNEDGEYKLEKYPKISMDNVNLNQYNMRPYIDNEYHNFKKFIYDVKKESYKKYVEECWGKWIEEDQLKYYEKFIESVKDDAWIIQLNGKNIGFYNGALLEDGSYEIGNICIIPEYQGKGIGTKILKDIIEIHKEQDIHIQYFKQNPVGRLYERLGFVQSGETEFHYKMMKKNK